MELISIPKSIASRPDYLVEKFSRPAAWIDLLLSADESGNLSFTISSLAARWKWQRRTVKSFLDELCTNCAIAYTMHNSGHTSLHNLTICNYDSYIVRCTDGCTVDGTVQKISPFSPSKVSPTLPPAPPTYTPSYTPPISPSENFNTQGQDASAYARKGGAHPPTPFPYPAPFILSSVERSLIQGGRYTAVQLKRQHLEANLEVIAAGLGMDEQEQIRFLDYYCQPLDHDPSDILAERSGAFDLEYRAKKWMEKNQTKQAEQPKSRMEKFAETSQRLTGIINGLFADSKPESAAGFTVPPDEQ